MPELKIKLNDIVSSREIKHKHRAPIYILNNSIKRNTIHNPSAHHSLTYDCKLPQLKMSKKEISHMLKYLLNKQELSLPDRNLIRRIMLDTFEEDLFQFGSKDFIKHIKMLQKQEGQIWAPESRQFYMVLKGMVRIKCGMIEYQKSEGEVFGELQLLSEVKIDQISFIKSSLVLIIEQQQFKMFFYDKYCAKFYNLERQLDCLHQFMIKIPKICKYTLLSKVERKVYQLGDKIVLKGQQLDRIIVVGDKLKEEQLKFVVKGCIGLYQFKKDKNKYQQSVYSPTNSLQLFSIKLSDFQQYITLQNSESLMNSSYLFMDKSFINSTNQLNNPQGKQKIVNFMRVRKVKLISQKRSKTQPRSLPIDNEFKFLKLDCLEVDLRPTQTKVKPRYNYKNSLTVSHKQKEYLR